ncbi:hypothetical protein HCG51_33930 (plasmid) [Tolypothrix sp. PCC 7910]|uniref:hypothetical protein n=1 Tax=Tolypothrix sp. PCC 7910 TaxID=2099387 RepID=UPI0014279DEE|nr:hypothetical protein [Tolypothrix sp. PCC 7910]QIR41711.1 hypothetical protein HCG51_33930 [Tolypothrix sp. PCC 7910]
MQKLTAFIVALVALSPSAALAQVSGYLGADGFFSIRGLEANKNYAVNLGGMPIIRAGTSNSCGILRIAGSGTIKASDRLEIKDEKSGNIYGFENSLNISIKETQRCDGSIKPEREIWKDDKGTIYISGLSPSSAQTIRLLSSTPTRTIKANICGFISFKIGAPRPGAIIVNNQAFVLANVQSGGGIVCRKGKLYVAYPPQPTINPIVASTWLQQNPISWSSSTQIASISGSGGSSWSPPPNPNPNPDPDSSCTVGVNCDPPPPPTCPQGYTGTPPNCQAPPPPTCPQGYTGTPPNCQAPPPPPPPTCPEGYTGTPPNCETPPPPPPPPPPASNPKPPYGSACRLNGDSLLIIGLPPNKRLIFGGAEMSNYREATASDSGKVILNGIDFNEIWEGSSDGLDAFDEESNFIRNVVPSLELVPNCV